MGTTYPSFLSKIEPGGTKNGCHLHGHPQPVPDLDLEQVENLHQNSLSLSYPIKIYCTPNLKFFIDFSTTLYLCFSLVFLKRLDAVTNVHPFPRFSWFLPYHYKNSQRILL